MRFTINVEDGIMERIDALCETMGVSRSQFAAQAMALMSHHLSAFGQVVQSAPTVVQSAPDSGAICTNPVVEDETQPEWALEILRKHAENERRPTGEPTIQPDDDERCYELIDQIVQLRATETDDPEQRIQLNGQRIRMERELRDRRKQIADTKELNEQLVHLADIARGRGGD